MAQLQILEGKCTCTNKNSGQEFQRKDGIKFCVCGKECSDTDSVCECGKEEFIFGRDSDINGIVGSYIELAKNGRLKDFYHKNINKGSIVKMNNKRIIQQLLVNRHRIIIPKEIIDKIYKVNCTYNEIFNI